MGRKTCPRCGNQHLSVSTEQRSRKGNNPTHKVEVQKCKECGWKNA